MYFEQQRETCTVTTMMGSLARPEPFFIEYGSHFLHGDLLPKDADKLPEILFLHGTLDNGRMEFLLLRQILWELYGLSSCAFDFIGSGSTPHANVSLSLPERVAQASDVIHACFDLQAFSVVAVATRAEMARSLAGLFPIHHWLALNPLNNDSPLDNINWYPIEIPVAAEQTLAYVNNNPALLAKVAAKINAVLGVTTRMN